MNRVIKFRAWHMSHMYYSDTISLQIDGTLHYLDIDGQWKCDNENIIKLMQFTGLYDNNGKEIYEGDILKNVDKYGTLKVKVQYEFNGFRFIGIKEPIYWNFISTYEIIGNIYENPVD